MSACDHPLDGHTAHGPWCEEGVPAEPKPLAPVTRVYLLPKEVHPRAEYPLLHEWAGHLPMIDEGRLLTVGSKVWRVRYSGVAVDEDAGLAVLAYTVQDAREEPRI